MAKFKNYLIGLVKLLVVALAILFIYYRLSKETVLQSDLLKQGIHHPNLWSYLIGVLLLAFLNRFFEILKWRSLASVVRQTTVAQATKQVLSAMVLSIFTPNGIGEYGAKAMFFTKDTARIIVFLNFVCNGVQMLITVVFGIIGLLILQYYFWLGIIFLGLIAIVLLYYMSKNIKVAGFSLHQLMSELYRFPRFLYLYNFRLGIFRYLFFTAQQLLIIKFFGVEVGTIQILATIMAVYLLASCLPNFQFFDFVVKGGIAIYFFEMIAVNQWVVMLSMVLMWILNVVLPVFVGMFYVLGYRVKKQHTKYQD